MVRGRPCTATTQSGEPCKSFALTGSDLCISHDPARAEHMRKARRAGGLAKSTDHRTAKQWAALSKGLTISDLPNILIGAGLACLNGDIEPQRVMALAGTMRAAAAIAETGEQEQRIRELEQLMASLNEVA